MMSKTGVIAGRTVDDLEDLRRRGLLEQKLVAFGKAYLQPMPEFNDIFWEIGQIGRLSIPEPFP